MQINVQKNEMMVFSTKRQPTKIKVSLNGEMLKHVKQFKYLGNIMTSDTKSAVDIKCRVAVAKTTLPEMKAKLTNLKMPFRSRYRILNCFITPILRHGSENWTLKKTDIRKIKVVEMWFLRRMEKGKWTEKITNEVLNKNIKKATSCQKFRKDKLLFRTYDIEDKIENLVVTSKIVGERARERRRTLLTGQLVKWANCENAMELF